MNSITELLCNTCSRYIESRENSKLLEEIKELLWAYLRQQCPSFLVRDCNACFSQIFEERTFGKLTPDETNIFSSLRTFHSFCETCQKDVVQNSSILVNFVTRSALQKCELNNYYNSWPQFVLKNKRLFPIHRHFCNADLVIKFTIIDLASYLVNILQPISTKQFTVHILSALLTGLRYIIITRK